MHACNRVCVFYAGKRDGCLLVQLWYSGSTSSAWMAIYLTGYSDCLTSFRQPLSLPWRCHTGLKNVSCDHCLRYCWVLERQGEEHLKNGLNVQIPRVLGIILYYIYWWVFLVSNFIW